MTLPALSTLSRLPASALVPLPSASDRLSPGVVPPRLPILEQASETLRSLARRSLGQAPADLFAGSAAPTPRVHQGGWAHKLTEEYRTAIERLLPAEDTLSVDAPEAADAAEAADEANESGQRQPSPARAAVLRNIRDYSRSLATSVAEFIRWHPSMVDEALAVGRRLALENAARLARGGFFPSPLFYRIAEEAGALYRKAEADRAEAARAEAARQAERERAAAAKAEAARKAAEQRAIAAQAQAARERQWNDSLSRFHRVHVQGSLDNRDLKAMDRLGMEGVVLIAGPDALQKALSFLPAGKLVQHRALAAWNNPTVTDETMEYPGRAKAYEVMHEGQVTPLQIRQTHAGSDYRLTYRGDWTPNPHRVTAAQRERQIAMLDTSILAAQFPPIDY